VPSRKATPPFTQEQWAEIAQSIRLDKLPRRMRRAIRDALSDYTLMSRERAVSQHKALEKLVTTLKLKQFKMLRLRLNRRQGELKSEKLTDQIEGLIEEIYAAEKTAQTVLQSAHKQLQRQPKSKRGAPRKLDRDDLAVRLAHILTRFTDRPIGVSRTRDRQNPDRFLSSGPQYRFVSKVFKLSGISIKGLRNVIGHAAQVSKKPSR
jgi:hypothetical protein